MIDKVFNKKDQKSKRKQLRNNATSPEQILWQYLKGKQLGVKFRRQSGIDEYIVDFFSPEIKLAIEIDGESHFNDEAKQYDELRTEFINSLNIEVIRFTNKDVTQNIMGVCQAIRAVISRKLLEQQIQLNE
ncbi:endonuclease domain-containing protein [Psychrobacter sp. HD31]|uniref:endonuclease domain-containing protein n=1 Tax=Psychrobacter sp. HD31 TaxID=3112003 RepID=UPI003DA45465